MTAERGQVGNSSAAEAVSEGKTTQEHLGDKYGGSMTSNDKRLAITHEYNFNGAKPTIVLDQIIFCLEYLEDMAAKYPAYRIPIGLVQLRVMNMTKEAETDDFGEYLDNPKGPFADVVKNAIRSLRNWNWQNININSCSQRLIMKCIKMKNIRSVGDLLRIGTKNWPA